MERNFETLRTQMEAETNAEAAAMRFINGVVAQYEAAGSDLARIAAVTKDLKENKAVFAEALVFNTARARTAEAGRQAVATAEKDDKKAREDRK